MLVKLKVHSHLVLRDSSIIKSPNTKLLSHLGPKPIYIEYFMLSLHSFNIFKQSPISHWVPT
jgi:hypothetical protein